MVNGAEEVIVMELGEESQASEKLDEVSPSPSVVVLDSREFESILILLMTQTDGRGFPSLSVQCFLKREIETCQFFNAF